MAKPMNCGIKRWIFFAAILLALLWRGAWTEAAEPRSFYDGKTITLIILHLPWGRDRRCQTSDSSSPGQIYFRPSQHYRAKHAGRGRHRFGELRVQHCQTGWPDNFGLQSCQLSGTNGWPPGSEARFPQA